MASKLSIVIPVHNGAKQIRKTALGILKQNYRNLELILVENGSLDNTWEVCKSIAENDHRCIAIQSDIKGTLIARKIGIEHASGDYITFSDADDGYKSLESLGNMVHAIEETHSDIVQFGNIVNSFGRKETRLVSKAS